MDKIIPKYELYDEIAYLTNGGSVVFGYISGISLPSDATEAISYEVRGKEGKTLSYVREPSIPPNCGSILRGIVELDLQIDVLRKKRDELVETQRADREELKGDRGMPKFRKKPVVIDAIQWDGANTYDVTEFFGDWKLSKNLKDVGLEHDNSLTINTLEGAMRARIDDWIIKGVNGEFYPCKPDIFEKTYEAV